MYAMKLSPLRLGFALGMTMAISMVLLGLSAEYLDWGKPVLDLIGSMYHGYDMTPKGMLMGAGWGFLDGFIGGMLIAWFYNCCCRSCCKRDDSKCE